MSGIQVILVLCALFGEAKELMMPTVCGIEPPYNLTACIGTNVTIGCIFNIRSEWARNYLRVSDSPRYIKDIRGRLTILNVSLADAGKYTHNLLPEDGPIESCKNDVDLHVVDCTDRTPAESISQYQKWLWLLLPVIIIIVIFVVSSVYYYAPACLHNFLLKIAFILIKRWLSRNCPNFNYTPPEVVNINFITTTDSSTEREEITQKLGSLTFGTHVNWSVGHDNPGADRDESGDSSSRSVNKVKLLPLNPIKCADSKSLFSGTLVTPLGVRYGVMSGHAVVEDALCKTEDGQTIGRCIFAVDELMSLFGTKIAVDLALIELTDHCVVENYVILKGRPHRLRIAKEMAKKGQEVFMMDSDNNVYHGIVNVVRISDGRRQGAMSITDKSGKSHVLNCSHSGISGSLIMSLSDSERDTVNVHGIFTSRYTIVNKFGETSMDVGIHLWEALKLIRQTERFKEMFESSDTDFEFVADNSAEISKRSSSYSFTEAFLCKRHSLIENIDVSHGLLFELIDRKLITNHDLMYINCLHTEDERVQTLIDMLEKVSRSSQFEIFCDALEATNQGHIVRLLKDEIELDGFRKQFSHTGLLRDRTEEIIKKFRVDDGNDFWKELIYREIFTTTQVLDCLYQPNPEQTAKKVIDILQRCEKCTFDRFVQTLEVRHGDEMANLFRLTAERALHSDNTSGELPTSVARSKDNSKRVEPDRMSVGSMFGEAIYRSLGLPGLWIVQTVNKLFEAAPKNE